MWQRFFGNGLTLSFGVQTRWSADTHAGIMMAGGRHQPRQTIGIELQYACPDEEDTARGR